ncbi:unnamed protein product [Musa acuminata subsp. malaccensis]|uniref:(wild Malaysian banana) hypothetical protein n=1 Tax=Musa acuminata subsp. malaccensis TaxID=214687 RepID=A0A804KQM6_MUSAM|nr:unnamed protein product [Musa acuminata subsp. malaccensis]
MRSSSTSDLRSTVRDGTVWWMESVLDLVPPSFHGEARPE